ncbi:MAG: methionine--tRNA ligase [Planctomycetaceae bacterium]|nr:methionine--tRNA ligase [Planctomycetaceae bacterium]
MSKTYYVTTPIYYVNDVPHIGHSYTTIAADVLARFFRSQGRDVFFLTGTDEHGIKIVKAAAEKNMTPAELSDQVVVGFRQLWQDLNISNDDFIRTSEPRHEKRVQELISRLVAQDEIYPGKYEGWYDEGQEEFVTESTARDNQYKSAINGKPLVRYSETNYFFRLGKWVPKLIEHIEANPTFVQPDSRRNEVLSKLRQGVEDLCVSRSKAKLPWGIDMPNDPSHVVYVWIDALSNYYTALGLPEIGDDYDGRNGRFWPCDVHLIGKDILWFHAVYWPCVLMALDIELPKSVFAHGWWTSEGQKMSKTLGNFISRDEIARLCGEYSRDVYRYYLLRAVGFGADGDFSLEQFRERYNTELANGVGNLLSRTVNMIAKYFAGQVPPPATPPAEAGDIVAAAEAMTASAEGLMEACAFHAYMDKIQAIVSATNRFIEVTEPFKLAKDPSRRETLAAILRSCAEAVRIILLYLQPVMPEAAAAGLVQLGAAPAAGTLAEQGRWGLLGDDVKVGAFQPLFPRKQ